MRINRIVVIGLVLFVFVPAIAWAQVPFFKSFQVDKERSEIRVQRIIKSRQGHLWLGTSEGLYKFNGIEFSKVSTEFIRDSSITALYEDSHQRLWIGFRNGKIATVENNKMIAFLPEGRLPKTTIHSIIEDNDSRIWFATNGDGVYYYSENVLHNISSKEGLGDDYTYALAQTGNGDMWIGTDQGISICKLNGTQNKITRLTTADGMPDNIVRVLLPDSKDNMWIGMQDKGVCKYMQQEKLFVTPEPFQNWEYGQVNCLMETEDNLWIGTDNNGVVDFEPGNKMRLRHYTKGENISLVKINDLLEDAEYNVWIANNIQLVRSTGEQISFLSGHENNLKTQHGDSIKTEFKYIHSILFDHNENLWFTPDQGLVKLSANNNSSIRFSKYTITPQKVLVDITSLYEDRYGYLWIGTNGKGIFRMNTLTGNFIKIKGDTSLEKASILSIAGKEDELWLAGLEGVTKCEIQQGETEHATLKVTTVNDSKSFGRNYVYCIFIDSRDRVWFGTDDKGIIVYDHGKISSFSSANGLRSNVIYSITEDPSGNIWFSTLKAGIYRYDGKTFKNYSTSDGLSDLNIYSIASDKYGNMLIVTKHGIDVLDPVTGLFSYHDRSSGIEEIIADLNSITKDNKGNIWIGTENGIIKYHPCLPGKIRQPFTVINKVSVFLEDVDHTNTIKFPHDQNNFTFSFSGLWFTDPERVFYQYMLEGYNNNWITSRDRIITYPRLAPGKYTFHVRSSLSQNFNKAKEAKYSFVITPPVWQRWWFKTILSLLIVIGLRYYIMNRERRIKHIDMLQKEKIEFQFETLKSQVNPHFLFNSFNTLITVIEENPKTAVEYVERMSQFFRNIVNYREKDVITLKEELDLLDNYYFLQKKRYCENLTLDIEIPEEIKNSRYVPPLTLQLLTENAVKHNAVSKETPLRILIFINKHGKLVVRNNTNKKVAREEPSGMGLENIINRFRLLSDRTVEIKSTDDFFDVAIPLLKEY